jgi:hypothetical protein
METNETGTAERIAGLLDRAQQMRRRAEALIAEAYEVEAEADAAKGEHALAAFHRALARGDGERGYIRLRAHQFLARGAYYEGDNEATRAQIAAEVERMRSEGGAPCQQ